MQESAKSITTSERGLVSKTDWGRAAVTLCPKSKKLTHVCEVEHTLIHPVSDLSYTGVEHETAQCVMRLSDTGGAGFEYSDTFVW